MSEEKLNHRLHIGDDKGKRNDDKVDLYLTKESAIELANTLIDAATATEATQAVIITVSGWLVYDPDWELGDD